MGFATVYKAPEKLRVGCGLRELDSGAVWTVSRIERNGAVTATRYERCVMVVHRRDVTLWFEVIPPIK